MANQVDRRSFVVAAAGMVAAVGASIPVRAQTPAANPAPLAKYDVAPLAFDPQKIRGFSEKILMSHYENNYTGAVKRLNAITEQLGNLDFEKAPGFVLNGLKREELIATNSMILHEIYFSELGEPNTPGKALMDAIVRDFGSFERWRSEFTAMGRAEGGGSGWVVLAHSSRDKRLRNVWSSDHTTNLAGGDPILVMDMYEHAYQMDFGAKAGDYVAAFMNTLNWRNADRLYEQRHKV